MRIGIMQPYFFPYLGYFSLIKQVDQFILLDDVQFIYHGWIERNRTLKPFGGWQYISVPLQKHSRDTKIADIFIKNDVNWKRKIIAQLEHYKKKAPYYKQVMRLLEEIFSSEYEDITSLNQTCLKAVCEYLKIPTKIELFRELGIQIQQPMAADEWALNICIALEDVTEYWNPEGGLQFFTREKYTAAGIDIQFLKPVLSPYPQLGQSFESGLSILDVVMFNSPEAVCKMLDHYTLL